MNNTQSILEKLKNLIEPESSILKKLQAKKAKKTEEAQKAEETIASKKDAITTINDEIAELNKENALLVSALQSLKDTDLSLLTKVLDLKVDVKNDLDKLTNQLPLQITIRENDIKDLKTAIEEEESSLKEAKSAISDTENALETAFNRQNALKDLLKEASHGDVARTRDEVIGILKDVEFSDEEAYKTAKLILFPEDDLVPFFKEYMFANETSEVKPTEEKTTEPVTDEINFDDNNDDFVDLDQIVSLLNEEPKDEEVSKPESASEDSDTSNSPVVPVTASEPEVNTDSDETTTSPLDNDNFTSLLEDETPISFEELKNLFNEDKEDEPIKESISSSEEQGQEPISLDELDKNKEENSEIVSGETSVEPLETKEDTSTEDETPFTSAVLEELKKSKEDISLVKAFDTSSLDSKEIIKTLEAEDINPADIPLVVYQNGLDNYLANLKTLKEAGYKPTEMELQKFGVTLSLIDNATCQENLKILGDYKVSLKNTNGKIVFKVLAQSPETLISYLDLIIEARETNLLTYNVKALSQNIPLILERINFCKEYNIPYTEEKNNSLSYNTYIFSQEVLESLVEKEVELQKLNKKLTSELEPLISKEAYAILRNNESINVKLNDAKKFDIYSKLINKLESISVTKENAYVISNLAFSTENTKRNLISLVNNLDEFASKDIILAGLFYNSHKTSEDFKKIEEML